MSDEFKVGDRVKVNWPGDQSHEYVGKVIAVSTQTLSIDFGPGFGGHNCYGLLTTWTGWHVKVSRCKHVAPKKTGFGKFINKIEARA